MRKGFHWGDLGELLLTNRRLMLMKKSEIVHEVPIVNMKKADWKLQVTPYTHMFSILG